MEVINIEKINASNKIKLKNEYQNSFKIRN